jgi:D-3-phosphoglycerate dehydrogenase / 2-oxoglutarate reductase
VLALVSGALTRDTAATLAAERSWELRNVPLVGQAVAAMSARERDLVRALIVESEPVGDGLLALLPSLELIGCTRSDPVNVDVPAATARGVAVIHTPGRNAEAVADFALGLCLAALRNIAIAHHDIVSGELTAAQPSHGLLVAPGDAIWRPDDPEAPVPYLVYRGRELSGLVVGVIGFGWTGQAVARRFAGLVREVHVADPAVSADVISAKGYIPATLAGLIEVADVVTIHARSATAIVGRDELKQMKHGAILINTARATVLDYEALLDALNSGQLRAAALDVFPEEPIRASSPLLTQPSLTLTPHLAGAAADVVDRQSEILLAAIRGLYDGAAPPGWDGLHVRNPAVLPRWNAARTSRAATGVGEAGAAG